MADDAILDAIVVGAGASGLMAGHTLALNGVLKFKILEAHDQVGGRVKKLDGFADFPLDLGGEWMTFHRNHDYGTGGGGTSSSSIYQNLVHGSDGEGDGVGDHDGAAMKSPALNDWHLKTFEWFPVTPWYEFDSQGKLWTDGHNFNGEWNHFVDYTYADYLNDYIASDIMDKVELNCIVNKIEYGHDDVPMTVSCKDGRTYRSHEIIMTANPKVMRDIDFVPPLPPYYQEAMRTFVLPAGMKVFLKFDRTFYHESFGFRGDLNALPHENPGERYFYNAATGQSTSDHVLSVLLRGSLADKYVDMSDMRVVATMVEELDDMYDGMATEAFVDGYVQNWSKDPFVQGSYSNGMWQQEVFKQSVINGKNRIQFAGEHVPTDQRQWALVHSATQSGHHAAMKIIVSGNDTQ